MDEISDADTGMKIRIKNIVRHKNTVEYRRRIPADLQTYYDGKKWISRTLGRVEDRDLARIAEIADRKTDEEFSALRAREAKRIDEQPNIRHLAWFGRNVTAEYEETFFRLHARAGEICRTEGIGNALDRTIFEIASPAERALLEMKTRLSEALEADEQMKALKQDKHRRAGVEQLIEVVGDIGVEDLKREHIRKFIDARLEKGNGGKTIMRRITAIRAMVSRYYVERDLEPPTRLWQNWDIPNSTARKTDREPIKAPDAAKIDAHMRSLEEEGRFKPRHYAIYWLIRCSGLGISEACGLTREDVRLDAEIPHVVIRSNDLRGLKTEERPRLFPLVGEALRRAKDLPAKTFDAGSMGQKLNKLMKEAVPTLQARKETLYSFRHNMADALYAAGASEREAQYLLGHAETSSHQRYGASTPDMSRLQEVVASACVGLSCEDGFV